jgi:hypothetical protein
VLPVGWLILAVALAVLLSMWVTFTATRLDRLHARVDAARAALDAQLVRRAAALLHVADNAPELRMERARYDLIAEEALSAPNGSPRQAAENRVGRAVAELLANRGVLPQAAAAELDEAAARVQLARRFYNDAVRDTRALRGRRMPRVLRLAGHAELPSYFDIDDTVPSELRAPSRARPEGAPSP